MKVAINGGKLSRMKLKGTAQASNFYEKLKNSGLLLLGSDLPIGRFRALMELLDLDQEDQTNVPGHYKYTDTAEAS